MNRHDKENAYKLNKMKDSNYCTWIKNYVGNFSVIDIADYIVFI